MKYLCIQTFFYENFIMIVFLVIPGRDLIGVQNLIKKHSALTAELEGHEPRIQEVAQHGQDMINNGHFASEEIQAKVGGLTVSIALIIFDPLLENMMHALGCFGP